MSTGSAPLRVAVAFGTRPEASKMAPVVQALRQRQDLTPWILVSGQHRQQLDAMMELFALRADADLAVMTERQELPELAGRIVPAAARALRSAKPDYCLVHGDTQTTFAVALAAFYLGVPVGHVEAGLRSFDLRQPFPEEANRRLTDVLVDLAAAPTAAAAANLRREGMEDDRIVVTGNTAVDAVRAVAGRAGLPEAVRAVRHDRQLVAITLHRRENLPALPALAGVLAEAAHRHPDHLFVWPLHLNPAVRDAVAPHLAEAPNLLACEPLDYPEMVALLAASRLIVTDSGGLQEEGASLGVPVAVIRNVTERPEGVEAGVLRLLGGDPERVREGLDELLSDEAVLASMRARPNPYGDGHAATRVAEAVAWRLGLAERPLDWTGPRATSAAGS